MSDDVFEALVTRAHTSRKWTLDELEDMLEALQQYRVKINVDR